MGGRERMKEQRVFTYQEETSSVLSNGSTPQQTRAMN